MSLPLPVRQQLLRLLGDVSQATGVKTATLLGRSRHQPVTDARFLFIHVAVHHVAAREQVAEFLRRDRTTIDHALRVVASLIKTNPASNLATLAEALSQPPVHQVHPVHPTFPHLFQPATPMITKRAPRGHKLQVDVVADAAREFTALLDRFVQDPRVTDIEVMRFLKETGIHCHSHYTDIRAWRRREGLEVDPGNDCRGLEAFLAMAEDHADHPQPQPTYPPRNPRPAAAA